MPRPGLRDTLALWILLLAASCSPPGAPQTATPAAGSPPSATATHAATASAPEEPPSLTLWVGPQFAPDPETEAGALLVRRLTAFESAQPGLHVNVRVKDASGPGSLLDALTAAGVAAPDALPDVISLDPVALHTATIKNLIVPLDGVLETPVAPEWYDHALGLTPVGESFHALPFASLADVLAFRLDRYDGPPLAWSDLIGATAGFVFPAGDPDAGFTLAQYLSLGGGLADGSGRPSLDPAILADVLSFYASAQTAGALIPSARAYVSSAETWAAFEDRRAASAIAPLSRYLTEHDAETASAIPLPTRSGSGVCFTETWSWAIVTQDPTRQAQSAALVEWLEDPAFLGAWTEALHLLPPKRAALQAWSGGAGPALASRLVIACRPRPSEEILTTFGPALRAAVETVLGGGTTPEAAALEAAQAVQEP